MDARLSLQQMRVLIALYTFRNKNTEMAHPTRQEISERTGMALTKISTATTDLERLGWLTKIGNGGRSQATRYRVHVPETITEPGTVKAPVTVTEQGMVNGRKTVPEQGSVTDTVTVTDSETVTESETVTDSALNGYRFGNQTVTDSVTGKEQTKNRPEQTISRPARKPVAARSANPPTDETELQAACKKTWGEYGAAFKRRYGTAPVRNASVNAKVKQFVQRIGFDESPAVAAFYVDRVTEPFVLRKVHDVGLLLSGAEGYRTQWASGRTTAEPNRQEALETRNRNIAADWAEQGIPHAAV